MAVAAVFAVDEECADAGVDGDAGVDAGADVAGSTHASAGAPRSSVSCCSFWTRCGDGDRMTNA